MGLVVTLAMAKRWYGAKRTHIILFILAILRKNGRIFFLYWAVNVFWWVFIVIRKSAKTGHLRGNHWHYSNDFVSIFIISVDSKSRSILNDILSIAYLWCRAPNEIQNWTTKKFIGLKIRVLLVFGGIMVIRGKLIFLFDRYSLINQGIIL